MNPNKHDLLTLLETIILMQMLVENLDELKNKHYDKQLVKNRLNALLKTVSPLAERDYNIVFKNGEHDTQSIISEYEALISHISNQQVPQKVALSQMVQAWNFDRKTMEATTHRILKKFNQ